MSIILKGVDIPDGADFAHITFTKKGNYLDDIEFFIDEIVQIPKGHGRLIDADALETVFKDMAKCEWNQKAFPISWAYAFEDTIDEIHDAPTILESEGTDEHNT